MRLLKPASLNPIELCEWPIAQSDRTVEQVRSSIDQFKDTAVEDLSEGDVRRLILCLAAGYVTRPRYRLHGTSFRARQNIGNKLFDNVAELLAPPAEFVKRRGRFNREGESVLYINSSPMGAVFEINPQPFSAVTVLVLWQDGVRRLSEVGFGGPTIGMARELMAGGVGASSGFFAVLQKRAYIEQWLLIDQLFGSIARQGASNERQLERCYKVSRIVWDLMSEAVSAAGMQYPSVQDKLASINMVDRVIDGDFRYTAIEAWLLQIVGKEDARPEDQPRFLPARVVRRGQITEDGYIAWQKPCDEDPYELHKKIAPAISMPRTGGEVSVRFALD